MKKLTPKSFIKEASRTIYNGIMININQSFNVSKTSRLAINLLVKSGLNVNVVQHENACKISNLKIKDLLNATIIEMNEDAQLEITFFTSGKLEALLKSIEKNEMLFIAYYLSSIHRIVDGTYTNEYAMSQAMQIGGKIGARDLIEINANVTAMKQALSQMKISDLKKSHIKQIYAMQEEMNLELLDPKDLATMEATTLSRKYKNLRFNAEMYTVPKRVETNLLTQAYGFQSGNEGKRDTIISNIREALNNDISSAAKGNQIGSLFAAQFAATKVCTKWVKKIQTAFNQYVQHETSQFDCSWASMNNTYRHLFKSPKKKHIEEKINLILSIDQSGSISTRSLSQVLHVILKRKKHIGKLYVLLHDAAVTATFEFDNLADASHSAIMEAVGTRRSSGGTSNLDVFKHMNKILKKEDVTKFAYFCFTDGHSDIEDCWTKYPRVTKLKTFLLNEYSGRGHETAKTIGATLVQLPA